MKPEQRNPADTLNQRGLTKSLGMSIPIEYYCLGKRVMQSSSLLFDASTELLPVDPERAIALLFYRPEPASGV